MFQCLPRRFLFGSLLGRALRPPHELPRRQFRQPHLYRKCLLVFRAFLFDQFINRLRSASRLHRLLQRGLEIHHRDRAGLQFHVRQFRLHDRRAR